MTFPCPRFPPQYNPPRSIAADNEERDGRQIGVSEELEDTDPRDHSRIKAAFDAMVEVRCVSIPCARDAFINGQLICSGF